MYQLNLKPNRAGIILLGEPWVSERVVTQVHAARTQHRDSVQPATVAHRALPMSCGARVTAVLDAASPTLALNTESALGTARAFLLQYREDTRLTEVTVPPIHGPSSVPLLDAPLDGTNPTTVLPPHWEGSWETESRAHQRGWWHRQAVRHWQRTQFYRHENNWRGSFS